MKHWIPRPVKHQDVVLRHRPLELGYEDREVQIHAEATLTSHR